jgi:hypothetical protein
VGVGVRVSMVEKSGVVVCMRDQGPPGDMITRIGSTKDSKSCILDRRKATAKGYVRW